jgi:phage-related protein
VVKRRIVFYKEYFEEFFLQQRSKVRDKLIWTFTLIEELEKVPETYLKHIDGSRGLYEIRVQQGNDAFRIFCFFDEGQIIVLANGFVKKMQKTPRSEILKAEKIKREYEDEKAKYNKP